ncbi:MAG: glucose-6-phosphate dehydrogenase [Thermoleophilaceae bacterium]
MAVSAPDVEPREAHHLAIPPDHVIVLFGATGDLATRKLWPGLYHLEAAGLMPPEFAVIATARGNYSDDELRALARKAVEDSGRVAVDEEAWARFARRLSYTVTDTGGPRQLDAAVEAAEQRAGGRLRRLHYLSVPTAAMAPIVREIGRAGLAPDSRVILEKPFGTDLASARELNALLHEVFEEEQVFRIDHFLGKEAVQNILALRFANGMWEPVWNREHIEHVQIDVPETLGLTTRTAFYEATGAFRDMVVTHLFQLLGFVAMEPPTALRARELVAEKDKVFQAMRALGPDDLVRAQYSGYRDEPGVRPGSETETLAAARVWIDNWRWAGVPFFLRTGKLMTEGRRLVTIAFRDPPTRMFPTGSGVEEQDPNHLSFDLGDPGCVSLGFQAKTPGPGMEVEHAHLTYSFASAQSHEQSLEAYERLIYDAMVGDHTLFTTAHGVERLWEVSDRVLADPPALHRYASGSWGPPEVDELIAPHRWHLSGRGH